MSGIFAKIISREIPANIIAENDEFLSFLDINPLNEGHCLVIPKIEIDYIFDLEDDVLARMHVFAKKVAHGIKRAIPCERIGVSVIGLEVAHAHIHLVPINTMDDMNFSKMKLKPEKEELAHTAQLIKKEIVL